MAGRYGRRGYGLARRRRVAARRRGLYRGRRSLRMRGRRVLRAVRRYGEPWHYIDGGIQTRQIPRNGFGTVHLLTGTGAAGIVQGDTQNDRVGQWIKQMKVVVRYELCKNAAIPEDRIRVLIFTMKELTRPPGGDVHVTVWDPVTMGTVPGYFGFPDPSRVNVLYDRSHRLATVGAATGVDSTVVSRLGKVVLKRLPAARYDGIGVAAQATPGRGGVYIAFFSEYIGEDYSFFNMRWRLYFKP